MILESAGDIEVVGEAGDGGSAVEEVRRHRPDAVLMDIRRPCCVASTRGRVKASLGWDQIAKTSSSNATATRRLVGSSTASS